ncbi:3'-5' exonuclease domain-containing protein [Toxoplasma gondii ARI]|uniref:3'-5' exonuclease domain-containing protein n=1 Tax=Toxoplasma gondii ARI TaxID=1074872 RepID=A0A139YAR9_TOXGO|nr:3'-5' exonuclease domain-containing protein [Toxoplasma gondii ARI]
MSPCEALLSRGRSAALALSVSCSRPSAGCPSLPARLPRNSVFTPEPHSACPTFAHTYTPEERPESERRRRLFRASPALASPRRGFASGLAGKDAIRVCTRDNSWSKWSGSDRSRFSICRLELKSLPRIQFSGRIIVVRTLADDAAASEALLKTASASCGAASDLVLGYDSEHDPLAVSVGGDLPPSLSLFASLSPRPPLALIQLASPTVACIWQLSALGGLPPGLTALLLRADVVKVTQGATGEVEALQREFGVSPRNFLCLHAAAIALGCATNSRSLQALCGLFLERFLDKSLQLSTWSRDALSPEQCMYAATDAYVSRQVLFGMREQVVPKEVMRLVEAQATLQLRCTQNEDSERRETAVSGSVAASGDTKEAERGGGGKCEAHADANLLVDCAFETGYDSLDPEGGTAESKLCLRQDSEDALGDTDCLEAARSHPSVCQGSRGLQVTPEGEKRGGRRGLRETSTVGHAQQTEGRTETPELGEESEHRESGSEPKSGIVRSKLQGARCDREVFVATLSRQESESERTRNSPVLKHVTGTQATQMEETALDQLCDGSVKANDPDQRNRVEFDREGEASGTGTESASPRQNAGQAWVSLKETCVERGWRLECTRLESCRNGFRSVFSVNSGVSGVFVAKSSEAHTNLRAAQNDAAAQMLTLLAPLLTRKREV